MSDAAINILKDYLTKSELADQLRRDPRTIDRWSAEPDGLPYTSLGGERLFYIPSVMDWLRSRERHPNQRRRASP